MQINKSKIVKGTFKTSCLKYFQPISVPMLLLHFLAFFLIKKNMKANRLNKTTKTPPQM